MPKGGFSCYNKYSFQQNSQKGTVSPDMRKKPAPNENPSASSNSSPTALDNFHRHPVLWVVCLAAANAILLAGIAACFLNISQANKRIAELEEAAIPVQTTPPQIVLFPKDEEVSQPDIPLFDQETIKGFAATSKDKYEFLQRFFDDTFVYSWKGETLYVPVDGTLPMNSYNWDNLVLMDKDYKEYEYQEYGVTKTIKGIDVSKHQANIDWERVAADGVDYAFLRVGYRGYGTGAILVDEAFHQNARAANQAGVPIGAYFFSQAINAEEAVEEAELAIEALKDYDITYPVAIDLEDVPEESRTSDMTREEFTKVAIAFCERIKEAGYTPMIYCNSRWFTMNLDLSQLTEYDKWFAQYYNRPFFPYDFQIWQYSSTGRVDGIQGDVDLNISFVRYGEEEKQD